MSDEVTKDVEVGGRRYQLSKVTAMVGSRIHGWMIAAAVAYSQQQRPQQEEEEPEHSNGAAPQDKAEAMVGTLWLTAGSFLSEETYSKIQVYCLRACAYYPKDSDIPIPVVMQDGRFADKALEQDAVAVSALIARALKFNISPFFLEHASRTGTA